MLKAFYLKNNRMHSELVKLNESLPKDTTWIDIIDPETKEEEYIEKILGIEAPNKKEMEKHEVINPFFVENDVSYMTATILDRSSKDYPDSTAITFIIKDSYLITTRFQESKSFEYFYAWIFRNTTNKYTNDFILTSIVDFMVNCCADILEETGNEINNLLNILFEKPIDKNRNSSYVYNEIIRKIGSTGTLISRNRESLVSLNRLIIFFSQIENGKFINKKDTRLKIKHISREISSMNEYANFLSKRNAFLLDATLGMISVEQNTIIKFFTVAAVVFMPPTLIASIYGMNFSDMLMLKASYGFEIVLLLILISAFAPYILFKNKGWL